MPSDKRYTVEGFWDCQYCGTKGLKGRSKYCPNCGHPRDESVRFYTKEIGQDQAITREEFARETAEADKNSRSSSVVHSEARVVEDGSPSLYSQVKGGPAATASPGDAPFAATDDTDWLCDYCGSYNPATLENCRYCAASREMSSGKTYKQVAGTMARTYDAQGRLVNERDLSKPKTEAPKATAPKPKAGGGFSFSDIPGCFKFLIVLLGLVGLIYLLHFIFYAPKARDITVDGFDWQQTIQIEELQTVDDSGWSLPEGGRLSYTREEVSGYNHVLDHYTTESYEVSEQVIDHYETYTTTVDNGDGTFDVEEHREPVYTTQYHTEQREVPVYVDIPIYNTKYYYQIEQWVPTRQVETSGSDHSPTWGEVTLSGATGEHGTGEEREGDRWGTYGVTDSEGNHYTADLEFWETLEEGQKLSVMVDGEGHMTPKG